MSRRLQGKKALVTGGSRGIGLAVARRFCEEGARVVIASTEQGQGREVAARLATTRSRRVFFEPVDMANIASVEQMVGNAAAQLCGIDVLVNNAGIMLRGRLQDTSLEEWDRVQAVNLRGPVFCMRAAYPYMQKGGSIINIVGIAGLDGPEGTAAYAASKAGLIVASEVAAKEYGLDGIRVNVVAPGLIETDMSASLAPSLASDLMDRTPLGLMGTPQQVADVCLHLASGESAFMNGAVLRLDGGLRL